MRYASVIFFAFVISIFSGCIRSVPHDKFNLDNVPSFNSDSAFELIRRQVMFGPRVPNTPAHDSCAQFIMQKLLSYGFDVDTMSFTIMRYDSVPMHCTNIFASFNPSLHRRILLFTHWDSRFIADKDKDSILRNLPVPGANDGGSGTAVLMEIARLIASQPPQVGVDLLFLDAEDQGPPDFVRLEDFEKYWARGASYWVDHKPKGYKPMWALGLDLVGAKNTRFAIEDNSLYFYGYLIKRIWDIADSLGYDTLFIQRRTRGLMNDHIILFQKAHIRSVMISENIPGHIYGNYWHTHKDSLDIIDPKVLKAVGQTVVTLIYNVR